MAPGKGKGKGKGKGIVLAAPATEPARMIQASEHYMEHYLVSDTDGEAVCR